MPRELAGPLGWWYVFGSSSLTLFMLQIVTGIGLSLTYVPSAGQAYESLLYLNYQQPWGWFLRSLHYWSGSAMVVMVLVHMTQVFLHAAYKYPRELTWVVGVGLLLCTLGMAFTGQVLRVGSGRILGSWSWCVDGWARAGSRTENCRSPAGWSNYRRGHTEPIFRCTCL